MVETTFIKKILVSCKLQTKKPDPSTFDNSIKDSILHYSPIMIEKTSPRFLGLS